MTKDQEYVWNTLKGIPRANERVSIDDQHILNCPYCNDGYLHQYAVEVFVRKCEDSNVGLKITTVGESFSKSTDVQTGNPSNRRDGIVIKFTCEGCEELPELLIIQDRGNTQIKWKEFV